MPERNPYTSHVVSIIGYETEGHAVLKGLLEMGVAPHDIVVVDAYYPYFRWPGDLHKEIEQVLSEEKRGKPGSFHCLGSSTVISTNPDPSTFDMEGYLPVQCSDLVIVTFPHGGRNAHRSLGLVAELLKLVQLGHTRVLILGGPSRTQLFCEVLDPQELAQLARSILDYSIKIDDAWFGCDIQHPDRVAEVLQRVGDILKELGLLKK